MAQKPELIGASAQGLSQFEKERLKRIEENRKRMNQMMAGVDVSLLVRQPQVTPVRPKKRKSEALVTTEKRRSSRISNMPTPLYCIDEDTSDRTPASRSRASTGPTGRHFHGIAAAATAADVNVVQDLYLCGKKGWKPECGSASLEAADAATDAALALQKSIVEAGGHASVKLMSASQVSGGFWSQLPYDITTHYGNVKRTVYLHCCDKEHQDPGSFMYSVPGSSTCWPVVYLPKTDNQGFGLSGGWRGFAIDMRLFPNDTVVHEVLDHDPRQASTAAAAAAGAAGNTPSSSSGNSSDAADTDSNLPQQPATPAAGGSGSVRVSPNKRMHIRVHVFRASAYEKSPAAAAAAGDDSASQQQSQRGDSVALLSTPGAAAAEPVLGSDSPDEQQQQQNSTQLVRSGSADDSVTAASADNDGTLDMPLAKRAKQASPAAVAVPALAAAADLMAAAEAGLVRGVKVLRQSNRSSSRSKKGAGSSPADCVKQTADADVSIPLQQQKEQQHSKAAKGAAAGTSVTAEPRQRRTAAATASRAWAFAAAKRWVSSSSALAQCFPPIPAAPVVAAAAGDASKVLVPQPVDPSELVAAPTADEKRRARGRGPFPVKQIVAHRVNSQTGGDELLISWLNFGPYWDSWESSNKLTHRPGSYDWKGGDKAIPDKFRL